MSNEKLLAKIQNEINGDELTITISSPKIISFRARQSRRITENTLEKRKRESIDHSSVRYASPVIKMEHPVDTYISDDHVQNLSAGSNLADDDFIGSDIMDDDVIDIEEALQKRNSNALNSDDIAMSVDDRSSKSLLQNLIDNANSSSDNETEPVDLSSMSPKEFRKYQKEQEEIRKRAQKDAEDEKRIFNEARREAHKRGYDTSILEQFDDPEKIYDLSNEEVERVEAVSYINNDGFYDFVAPDDIDSIRQHGLSTQRMVIIMIAGGTVLGFIAWLIRNISLFL